MSISLFNSALVNKCPRHIMLPEHYSQDGCECVQGKDLTLRAKEALAVKLFRCPVCDAYPGHACLHQNATRMIKYLKSPHPERVQMVDPDAKGYRRRSRSVTGGSWTQSDSRNKHVR